MAQTSSLERATISRVRPKPSTAQIDARKEKMRRLSAAVEQARQNLENQATEIAADHHR